VSPCLICLGDADERYHAACARALFDLPAVPRVEVALAKLHTAALAMVGKTSLSGVQRKLSLRLSPERATLQVAVDGGRFILKPQTETFPSLPENEHVTMRIAAAAGVVIPPCGLVHLDDDSLAYIVKRFDRIDDGGKRRQEDFCQLAEKPPKERYDGSAELCVRLLQRYASEPIVDLRALYRQLVVGWWTGNGDLHLKNLSLLATEEGLHKLSPAYDMLCTRLVIAADRLALPVGGRDDQLTRRHWLELADYGGLPRRAAERVLRGVVDAATVARDLVGRSLLPQEMKERYEALLVERAAVLEAG
jgi:serine/threonine-protein kinase HipA